MPKHYSIKNPQKQKGLILVVLIIIIVLAFLSYIVTGLSVNEVRFQQEEKTRHVLKKAKEALIAYAVNYPEINVTGRGPGYLPCPDIMNNGNPNPPCEGAVGRLPWREINSDDIRDGAGERLWYAVTRDFANFPLTNLNGENNGEVTLRSSDGQLIIDGSNPVNNPVGDPFTSIIAVIIAPGTVLERDDGWVQDRTPGVADLNDPVNYLDIAYDGNVALEEDNATFVNGSATDGFIYGEIRNAAGDVIVNDVIEVITYRDIMEVVYKRVGGEIANIINEYFDACDAYPEASAFGPANSPYSSAGFAPPLGGELREGHLPLNNASPVNWGDDCTVTRVNPAAPPATIDVTTTTPVPPAWLASEGWDATVYYKFAYQNALQPAPLPSGMSCGSPPNPGCLTVNNTNPLINNAQALIVFAGRDITGGRPSNTMSDYFEGENGNVNDIYDAGEAEDYVRVIAP